jgi:hypothetical protein
MIMKNYISEELYNKVYHLSQQLKEAVDTIDILEKENQVLKEKIDKVEHREEYIVY